MHDKKSLRTRLQIIQPKTNTLIVIAPQYSVSASWHPVPEQCANHIVFAHRYLPNACVGRKWLSNWPKGPLHSALISVATAGLSERS